MSLSRLSVLPLFALLTACGSLTAADNARSDEDPTGLRVRLAPEVVLLDDAASVHGVDLADDHLVLHLESGHASPVDLGSVVVGTADGGYLREVVDLEHIGDTVVAHTVRTDISRVFLDAQWDLELQQAALRSAEEQFGTEWDFGGTVLVNESFSTADGNVNLNVHIADGAKVKLTPTIRTKAEFFDGAVVDAGFQMDAALDYNADFVVQSSGRIAQSVERTVISREVQFMEFIGPVPVIGTAKVDIVAGMNGAMDTAISTTLHTEAHGAVHMGAGLHNIDLWTQAGCGLAPEWGYEGFNSTMSDCFSREVSLQDTTSDLNIQAKAFVRAEITFELYDSAGATVKVEPWAEVYTCNPPEGGDAIGVDFDAGLKGEHSYHYSVLWGMLSESVGPYPWGDELRWDIYPSEPMTCAAL